MTRALAVLCVWVALIAGCDAGQSAMPLSIPGGAASRLQVKLDGQLYGFGPFVGYYFRPLDAAKLDVLEFWCFNERGFYSTDAPVNALLYTGIAKLSKLAPGAGGIPRGDERIIPVFFDDAPDPWLDGRPEPKTRFVHFHSLYNTGGAVFYGYWLAHRAERAFTYDMGGRVGPASVLYHLVEAGDDLAFAHLIEFDKGP